MTLYKGRNKEDAKDENLDNISMLRTEQWPPTAQECINYPITFLNHAFSRPNRVGTLKHLASAHTHAQTATARSAVALSQILPQ